MQNKMKEHDNIEKVTEKSLLQEFLDIVVHGKKKAKIKDKYYNSQYTGWMQQELIKSRQALKESEQRCKKMEKQLEFMLDGESVDDLNIQMEEQTNER